MSPPRTFDTLVFLSDFGSDDEFVGLVHRVIRRVNPDVTVVDLVHGIPVHGVRAGALALWRSAPWLAPAVVLAVVDPGGPPHRRPVAVEAASGELVLVGPDNGLLTPAALTLGPLGRAVRLGGVDHPTDLADGDHPAGRARPVGGGRGSTFAGRDLLAPVAARLAGGVDLTEIGESFDARDLVGGPVVPAEADPAIVSAVGIEVEVWWVDRFGNVALGVRPEVVDVLGPRVTVELPVGVPVGHRVAVRSTAYSDLRDEQLGLIVDADGLLALCLNRASAAAWLGLAAGDRVWLGPLDRSGGNGARLAAECSRHGYCWIS